MTTLDEMPQSHIHATSVVDSLELCRSAERFKILKSASQAFIVSLIIHGVILLILSAFLVVQMQPFDDFVAVSLLSPPVPPKPQVRKLAMKPVVQPTVPMDSITVVKPHQRIPRSTTGVHVRDTVVATKKVIAFSNRPLQLESRPQPHRPKTVDPSQPIPQIVTYVDLPTSDMLGALASSVPAEAGSSLARFDTRRGTNWVPEDVRLKLSSQTVGLQSFIGSTNATPNALESLVNEMRLGNQLVPPMRPNELGARIYIDPRTGLPTGQIQICYVRFRHPRLNTLLTHEPTALPYLMRWMSIHTRIRGRIAGRAPYIDDPEILQSPMLYLNGGFAIRFSSRAKQNLTRYLVEKGGFIFVDDEQENIHRRANFAQSMRSQFREIILAAGGRELQRIPNNHPIWNQPFSLGGQPPNPHSEYLTVPMTAFELDGHLAVVISYHDYNNGWEAPGRGVSGVDAVPSALRMGVNFLFYAATHGKISDYKHYIPPDSWRTAIVPFSRQAPFTATISATETER
jgi:hypothetical protein